MLAATCAIWCLVDCGAIAWPPSSEPDVTHYLVRSLGQVVAIVPQSDHPQYALPELVGPTEFGVVAVDAAGQESLHPAVILVDTTQGPRFQEMSCDGECKQLARRRNPERKHYCEVGP